MKYWLLNAVCGLIVLLLLGGHMATMHLDDVLALWTGGNTEPLAFEQVRARGASLGMTIAYVVLLATALFHGLYGLQTILTERWSGARATARIRLCCWAVGLGLFAVGAGGTLVFYFQGTAT